MAIRPVDLQATIFQSTLTAQTQRQAEVAPQTAQTVAQQQWADQIEERQETVTETQHTEGNRVEEKGEANRQDADGRSKRRKRQPGDPLDELEDSVLSGAVEGQHLIDFTA